MFKVYPSSQDFEHGSSSQSQVSGFRTSPVEHVFLHSTDSSFSYLLESQEIENMNIKKNKEILFKRENEIIEIE